LLSDRRNIVVIADEAIAASMTSLTVRSAHARGIAKRVVHPDLQVPDRTLGQNTRAVFGNYISVYDIERAVKDGSTVPIYYESRLAKLELNESEKPKLDEEFEELTEGEEVEHRRAENQVGPTRGGRRTEKRISLVAEDLVNHFEQRLEAMGRKSNGPSA